MAILIEGKTICRLCDQPIGSKSEAVGIPPGTLPAEFDSLNDGVVHRACLLKHPQKNLFSVAWGRHWQRIAANSSQQAILEHGMQLGAKRRLIMVQFDTFIEIEERLEDIARFNQFFSSIDDETNANISLAWNRYVVSWSNGIPQLLVEKLLNGLATSQGGTLAEPPTDLSLSYRFSLDEWHVFQSICSSAMSNI